MSWTKFNIVKEGWVLARNLSLVMLEVQYQEAARLSPNPKHVSGYMKKA